MFIKLIEETTEGVIVEVQICEEILYKITIPIDKVEILKSSLREIKIGFTSGGINTSDPGVIAKMEQSGEHVALADLFLTPDGALYRMFWARAPNAARREKMQMVKDFEDTKKFHEKLVKNGFRELDFGNESHDPLYDFINKEINKIERQKALDSGRIACIGESMGCMETTNGSQFCCKTYCPVTIE